MFPRCEPQQRSNNRHSVLDRPKPLIKFPLPDLRSTHLMHFCWKTAVATTWKSLFVLCVRVFSGESKQRQTVHESWNLWDLVSCVCGVNVNHRHAPVCVKQPSKLVCDHTCCEWYCKECVMRNLFLRQIIFHPYDAHLDFTCGAGTHDSVSVCGWTEDTVPLAGMGVCGFGSLDLDEGSR